MTIGRGRDAFDRLCESSAAPAPFRRPPSSDSGGALFVAVPDGRVSRVHCQLAHAQGAAVLIDMSSSNGTFLNGEALPRGGRAGLADGDRISLVLSVAPLYEQGFTFHAGPPAVGPSDDGQPPEGWAGWAGQRELSLAAGDPAATGLAASANTPSAAAGSPPSPT